MVSYQCLPNALDEKIFIAKFDAAQSTNLKTDVDTLQL